MNTNQLNKLAQNSIVQNEPEPMIVGGERQLNPSEKVIVDEQKPLIDKALADILEAQQDLMTIGNTAALVQAKLEADAKTYDQEHSVLENAIDVTKTKLDGVVNRIELLRGLNGGAAKEEKTKRRGTASNGHFGLWIILGCLVFDLISLMVTWTTQRQVFGMDVVKNRAFYVAAIFGISLGIHFLFERTGNKVVLGCLIVSLFMSVLVAGHTFYIVYSTEEVETVGEFSLDLVDAATESTPAQQKSMLEKLFAEPGLLEFLFMLFLFAVAGSITLVDRVKETSAKGSDTTQDPLETSLCLLAPLNTRKNELEQDLVSQKGKLKTLEQDFAEKKVGYQERLQSLSEEADAKKQILVKAKETITQQLSLILQNLMVFLAVYRVMKAVIDDVPESSVVYPAVTESDLRRHLGMNVHDTNNQSINN